MGMLYLRTIEVRRPISAGSNASAVGDGGYSGMTDEPAPADAATQGETVLLTGVPANVQASQTGRKKDSALPSDAVFAPTWRIYCPKRKLAKGSVQDRDIIVDDEGYRYEVGQAYWNLLGYQIICIRLEA